MPRSARRFVVSSLLAAWVAAGPAAGQDPVSHPTGEGKAAQSPVAAPAAEKVIPPA